jgi:putative hemolysin
MAVLAKDALPRFSCSLASTQAEIKDAQRLRYQIFAMEMGADIDGGNEGLDCDALDAHCEHLIVRNDEGVIVACTRLLTGEVAAQNGGYYSAHEFHMSAVTALDGRKLEIGRTCVHADHRTGTTISVLWTGLADYVAKNGIDYLFGCASIPLDDVDGAHRIIAEIRNRYLSAPDLRVSPTKPLPTKEVPFSRTRMPPLLKAYVSLGARACGEAYWDTDFNCADVLMLLNLRELHPRYAKRFLGPTLTNH